MDDHSQVDVVYTDFEKAFDRVDHVILLRKLRHLGIHGDLLRWVESYLSNRSQAVVVGGYKSDFVQIPSGVPQGSHLGPLFYNVYLYDIYTCFLHSKFLMYADDTKIFLDIKTEANCHNLQADLNRLSIYYETNRIKVNVDKCQTISFSRKRAPIKFPYSLQNTIIDKTDLVRDLGVYFDSKLLMDQHIDIITDKAYKNLGFVIRACKPFKDIDSIKMVYNAYVRSILEYASCIWTPQYITYDHQIERIQKKFINHLNYKSRKYFDSYESSCDHFNMQTLNNRRIVSDMMFLHDVLRSRVDCPPLLREVGLAAPARRTRLTPLLHVPLCRTNYAQNTVLTRITRTYNKHFSELDLFDLSKPSFKNKVNSLSGAPPGSDVELQCYIEASPKAMNSWYREDALVSDKILENPKFRITEKALNAFSLWMNLTIRALAPGDYGTYVCASVNALGKMESQVSLHRLELSMNGFGAEEPMVSRRGVASELGPPRPGARPASSHLTHHLPPPLYALLVVVLRYFYTF
ncbi:unnamed protein product [Plutella xylostella]|uniref:(diamondback moth) hypothetical protein n=1 Tax=Plutella xylostella TaxID=51655 RepID=A0A8S4GB48_PLUXY|nr:unnamed protein product [Plutella xylostella]